MLPVFCDEELVIPSCGLDSKVDTGSHKYDLSSMAVDDIVVVLEVHVVCDCDAICCGSNDFDDLDDDVVDGGNNDGVRNGTSAADVESMDLAGFNANHRWDGDVCFSDMESTMASTGFSRSTSRSLCTIKCSANSSIWGVFVVVVVVIVVVESCVASMRRCKSFP
jgi:hypothetical protein